jgi:hypothetical protein
MRKAFAGGPSRPADLVTWTLLNGPQGSLAGPQAGPAGPLQLLSESVMGLKVTAVVSLAGQLYIATEAHTNGFRAKLPRLPQPKPSEGSDPRQNDNSFFMISF